MAITFQCDDVFVEGLSVVCSVLVFRVPSLSLHDLVSLPFGRIISVESDQAQSALTVVCMDRSVTGIYVLDGLE